MSDVVNLRPPSPLAHRLMEIARLGAERHRNQVYDHYDLLAIEIMSVAAVQEYNDARRQIAELLRLTHAGGPSAALRSQLP
jgi:hypothetical protein